MKKVTIIVLVLMTILLSGFAIANAEEKVTVVVDPVWPPFEMIDEETKEMTGFDIDVIKAIAEVEGFEVELVNLNFDAAIPAVASCQYDASISAITITDERKEHMLFSDPYFTSGQILTVKVGNEAMDTKEEFKGLTIGGQTGTTGAIMAQEWADEGFSKVKNYDSVDLAFIDLKNGQIDATLTDDTVAYAYSESLGGIVPVGELFSSEQYGIAICKNNTELLAKINDGLKKITEDGTMDKIHSKYFDTVAE